MGVPQRDGFGKVPKSQVAEPGPKMQRCQYLYGIRCVAITLDKHPLYKAFNLLLNCRAGKVPHECRCGKFPREIQSEFGSSGLLGVVYHLDFG